MKKHIITVSREFGSGGRTIGKMIAQKLGIAFYDRELVEEVAKKSGFAHEFIEENGEHATATSSFLFNLSLSGGMTRGGLSLSDRLYTIQHNIITELADKESCVIVGRCADYILKDREDCIHTLFHADDEFRAERIVTQYGEKTDSPIKRLREKDEKRKIYYKHYTGRQWGLAKYYDIALDSGSVGIESCADIVVDMVQKR